MHCDRSMDAVCRKNLCLASKLKSFASALERFQVGDDVADLTGVEAKFGHGRMAGDDSLGQWFFQIFNRIALVQRAKRRRDRQWTVADFTDRMAARAIGMNDDQSALCGRRHHLLAFGLQWSQREKNCRRVGDKRKAGAELHGLLHAAAKTRCPSAHSTPPRGLWLHPRWKGMRCQTLARPRRDDPARA